MTTREKVERILPNKDIRELNVNLDVLLNSGNGEAMYSAMQDILAVLNRNGINDYNSVIEEYRKSGRFSKGS